MAEATQSQIERLCHDYAQRWYGQDWPLMDEDAKSELRVEAQHWLKCWLAIQEESHG